VPNFFQGLGENTCSLQLALKKLHPVHIKGKVSVGHVLVGLEMTTIIFAASGASSLLLFQEQTAPPVTDENVVSFDMRSSDALLPDVLSYYQCQLFEFPQLDRKHHIIQVL